MIYMFPVDIWRAFTIGKVPWCLSSSKTGKIASFWRAKQMWFVKLWADRHSVIDLDILAPSPQTPTLHVRRACEWAPFSSVHSLGLLVLQICIYFGFTHFWVINLTSSAMRWANLDSWSRLMHSSSLPIQATGYYCIYLNNHIMRRTYQALHQSNVPLSLFIVFVSRFNSYFWALHHSWVRLPCKLPASLDSKVAENTGYLNQVRSFCGWLANWDDPWLYGAFLAHPAPGQGAAKAAKAKLCWWHFSQTKPALNFQKLPPSTKNNSPFNLKNLSLKQTFFSNVFNSHAREASSTCFASSQGVNLTDLQRSTRKMSAKSTASKSHTWTSRLQSPNLRCPAERLCSSLTVEIRWISHDNQRRFWQLSSGHVKTHWASNLFWEPAKHGKPVGACWGARDVFQWYSSSAQNGTEEAFGWSVQIRTTTCWQFTCTVVDLIGFGEVDFDSASLSIQSKVKASVKTVRNARPKWTSCGTTRPLADGKNERERRISRKSYDMLWLCHNVQSFSK